MASISSLGIGSGIDIRGIVDQLVEAERSPVELRLSLKESESQAKISAFGTLKSDLSSFQGALTSLKSLSTFRTRKGTITGGGTIDQFSASISTIASPGSYDIKVTTLAKAHTVASSAFTSATDAVGTGTLSFSFGTFSGTFTPNPDKATKTVAIGVSDNSVQGIRDAVNKADIGVTASIVNDGSGERLLFTSGDSGADSSLKITISGDSVGTDTDTTGLSQLAYDPEASVGSGKNLTETVVATDAALTVNGIAITSESNKITTAISGVTLDLFNTDTTNKTLIVELDKDNVKTAIESFVTSYNTLAGSLVTLSGYDSETEVAGILIGDAAVRGVSTQLRRILGQTFDAGSFQGLSEIGITTLSDNTLKLDSAKLTTALTNDFNAVGRLFAVGGTPTDSLINYLSATSSTKDGTYAVEIDQLATQGTFDGSTGFTNITLNSSNKTFALQVDGVVSNTITLTEGVYDDDTELAALAAQIQAGINSDTNLTSVGSSVAVTYDATNDRFSITSTRYGTASDVQITSVNTALGLDSGGTSTSGVDVSGTIGGVAATGSGQTLTGAGNSAGLSINIIGGSIGLRGSVEFSRGYSDQLNTFISSLLASSGILEAKTDGLESDLEDIATDRTTLERRLETLEARLVRQFSALDILVSQLRSTSSFLDQQLANLPKIEVRGGN